MSAVWIYLATYIYNFTFSMYYVYNGFYVFDFIAHCWATFSALCALLSSHIMTNKDDDDDVTDVISNSYNVYQLTLDDFTFHWSKTIIVYYCFLLSEHVNYQLTTVQIKFLLSFLIIYQISDYQKLKWILLSGLLIISVLGRLPI